MGYHYDGGFAEYLVVPHAVLRVDGLNRIPDGVGFAEASVAEPLACVINGQELARVGEGDDVVVVGAGPIGCLHVRLARARGAAGCSWSSSTAERLDMSPPIWSHPTRRSSAARPMSVDEVLEADRRSRCRRRDHRRGLGQGAGGGAADGRAAGPDQLLRRPAQGQADDHAGLQPRALPRAHHRRRQRVEPRPQHARRCTSSRPVRCRSRTSSRTGCRWSACSTPSTSSSVARPSK